MSIITLVAPPPPPRRRRKLSTIKLVMVFVVLVFVLGQISLWSVHMAQQVMTTGGGGSSGDRDDLLARPRSTGKDKKQVKTIDEESGESKKNLRRAPPQTTRTRTLALLPFSLRSNETDVGLFYRGLVLRFVALVSHAQQEGHEEIFLPSLLWGTVAGAYNSQLPMEYLFDVDRWNDMATNKHKDLPKMVDTIEHGDCLSNRKNSKGVPFNFNAAAIRADLAERARGASKDKITKLLKNLDIKDTPSSEKDDPISSHVIGPQSFPPPLDRFARALANDEITISNELDSDKEFDLMPLVEHCEHPFVYGGSKRLATEYMSIPRPPPPEDSADELDQDPTSLLFHHVTQALRPTGIIRDAAQKCLDERGDSISKGMFVAIPNASTLSIARELSEKYNQNSKVGDKERPSLDAVFVAHGNGTSKEEAKEKIFSCGHKWATKWKHSEKKETKYTDKEIKALKSIPSKLLGEMIDYEIAAHHSAVFIGSSTDRWSHDVWVTRYFHGKGLANFYSAQGGKRFLPVPTYGRPPGMGPEPGMVARPAKSQWNPKRVE